MIGEIAVLVIGLFLQTSTPIPPGTPIAPVPTGTITPTPAAVCPDLTGVDVNSLSPGYIDRCRACIPVQPTPTSNLPTVVMPTVQQYCMWTATPDPNIGQPMTFIGTQPANENFYPCDTMPTPTAGVTVTSTPIPHYYWLEHPQLQGVNSGTHQVSCLGNDLLKGWVFAASGGGDKLLIVNGVTHNVTYWGNTVKWGVSSTYTDPESSAIQAKGQLLANLLVGWRFEGFHGMMSGTTNSLTVSFPAVNPAIIGDLSAYCYGAQAAPSPTPTPDAGLMGCNQVEYRDLTPAVDIIGLGNLEIITGSCRTLIPDISGISSFVIPQIVSGLLDIEADWKGVQVCDKRVVLPTFKLLNFTIPLDIILIPMLVFVLVAVLRL